MKIIFTIILTISLFMCLLTSCEKESSVVPKPYEFEGEWIWVQTTFGWSPTLNPDSIGHSLSLIIDHTKYTMLTDEVITDQLTYEFKTDTSNFGAPIESILLETGKQYYIRAVDSVNLVFDDGWYDGPVWYYVRK
jgi:hypothetical protein